MIKELIKDISYDKISLNQALTRAKLIAYKIDNGEFISWINNELNGYEDSSFVPEYRKFYCDIFVKVENPYYGSRLTPIDLTEINKQVGVNPYSYIHRSGILNIEKNLTEAQNANEQYGYVDFPIEIVKNIRDIFQNNDISALRRRIQFGNLNNILNVAKQKLLDTLLELNKAFPNLEDEYMNDDKKDTASQIITNIYGNNASSNIGVGQNFTQGIRACP